MPFSRRRAVARKGRLAAGFLGLVVAGLSLIPPAWAQEEAETPEPSTAVEVDREQLRRQLAEAGVVTSAPRPGWSDYLRDVFMAVGGRFGNWLTGRLEGFSPEVARAIRIATVILVSLLFLLLIFLLVSRYRGTLRPPEERPEPRQEPLPKPEERGLVFWRSEMDHALAEGDAAKALQALWWWWANAIEARGVDPSWTTRELLTAAGRFDLRPLGRAFDRLAYGTDRLEVGQVRDLHRKISGSDGSPGATP